MSPSLPPAAPHVLNGPRRAGDAPLLEEFEICTADTAYFPEWRSFLPCSQRVVNLARLRSVTLHHISLGLMGPLLVKPPGPDAPGALSSLASITLRALPGMVIPLNQVLALVDGMVLDLGVMCFL